VFKDPGELIAKWEEFSKENEESYSYVYITGGDNPATGQSWCPDCIEAKPFVDEVIKKATVTVFVGYVMDRNTWVGVGTHLYKKHPLFKAKGVPTFIVF